MRTIVLLFLAAFMLACGGGGGGGETPTTPTPTPPSNNVPKMPESPSQVGNPQWWNDAVFYEVFVRSYKDATTGPLAGDGIGDFRGLIENLDYLNDGDPSTTDDLGVTALWLMPIMDSPSYHGYDAVDYETIEPDYGDTAEFKAFMAAAKERGIRVIIDLVLNHTSSQHPWFQQSRDANSEYRDWYVWRNTNPGFLGPWGQPVWHSASGDFYFGLFWSGMPDLNFEHPPVTDEIQRITQMWLEDMDVDGFRLDAIRHLFEEGQEMEDVEGTHAWLRDYFSFYKSIKPDAMTVGEVWADSETVATYQGQMDMNFQFDLAGAILSAANNAGGGALRVQINNAWENFEPGQFATFITNHDQNRIMSQLGDDLQKGKLAASILLTIPGVPFVYYGEEIGMTGVKPDPDIRTPLHWNGDANAGFTTGQPWRAVNAEFTERNIDRMSQDSDSILSHYRRLIHIRNDNSALRRGNLTWVETSSQAILAFLRQDENQNVLVVLNLSSSAQNNFSIALDADYDGAVEALNGVDLVKGSVVDVNGVEGFQPITQLDAKTGYIIVF